MRQGAATLRGWASTLLTAAGLPRERGEVMAEVLVEAELMGHATHGLRLLDWYLAELGTGALRKIGEPAIIADRGAAVVWDGRDLPGAWLVDQAMQQGFARIGTHPVVTLVIRQSHHLGFHAAYVRKAAERGLLMLLTDMHPGYPAVAPFGGRRPLYSPAPFAVGIPTGGRPILIDFSLSSTSLARSRRAWQAKERLPGRWLLDREGVPTDDPAVLFDGAGGSILPLGGVDLGYKGFALALMVQAMTVGLGGAAPSGNGSAVFLQLIDPGAFAGGDAFARETSGFAAACRDNPARPGAAGVRLPGDAALERRERSLAEGIAVNADCVAMIAGWARKLAVDLPPG